MSKPEKKVTNLPSPLCDGSVFTTPTTASGVDRVAELHHALHELRGTLEADPSLTAEGRTAELASWAKKKEAAHVQALTDAAYAIQDRVDAANAAIDRDLKPMLGSGVQLTEVRSALRSMEHEERRKVVAAAVADGDKLTVGAAVHGPGWLAGLSKDDQEYFRHQWARARHPEALDEIKAAELDRTRLDGVIYSATQVWRETIKAGEDALAAQARTKAALAR